MAKKQTAPKEIEFTGCILRSGSLHNADEPHVKLEFTASWTDEIRNHMSWKEIPKGYGASDLLGSIAVSTCRYIPLAPVAKGGLLEQHAEEFSAETLNGFNLVPLKDKSGEVLGRELRFTMKTNQLNMIGKASRYVSKLGRAPGVLFCTLADEDRQEKLDTKAEPETE